MSLTQVLIVDDHAIFRQGLRKLFDEQAEFAIVGEASGGAEAISAVHELSPDILLLDLQLGDMTGLDVLRRLGTGRKTKTILLGADIQRTDELTAILLGASGVVGKYAASETLFRSIRAVMSGEMWVKREVIAELIGMLRVRDNSSSDALSHFGLTARELEIVKAVVQGMGNREISESLGISQFTVKHYMTRIFDKLLVANRVELALFATRQGLAQNRPHR
jgi:two-component system, NarL family, nitrate/nitrite response regulator NarL